MQQTILASYLIADEVHPGAAEVQTAADAVSAQVSLVHCCAADLYTLRPHYAICEATLAVLVLNVSPVSRLARRFDANQE